MKGTRSEYEFEPGEIARFESSLHPVDPVLREIARTYHMRVFLSSSKGWPGRMLRRWTWFKTYWFRISLTPTYIDTGRVTWDIHDVWMYDYGELFRTTISHHVLATGADEKGLARVLPELVRRRMKEVFPRKSVA